MATSVTQFGVTANFSSDRATGQYCVGDYWVSGPAEITSISPGSAELTAANWSFETIACTFQDSGDTVTRSGKPHGMENGVVLRFVSITGTTGISTGIDYYVVGKTGSTFQVSATLGGSPLALTTNGSGTYRVKSMDGRVVNGTQLNPGNRADVGGAVGANGRGYNGHGYDSLDQVAYAAVARDRGVDIPYSASVNVDPGKTGTALEVDEGTVVKFVSIVSGAPWDMQQAQGTDMVPITVVPDGYTPPTGAFRPPVAVAGKQLAWTESMLDYSVLPKLTLPVGATMPNLADTAAKLRRMHTIQWTDGISVRHIAASNNQEVYGRDIARYLSDAALILCLDLTDGQKRDILVNFVQMGIDVWGRLEEGGVFPDAGGGSHWHKFALCLAGVALRNAPGIAALRQRCDPALLILNEDRQYFEVDWPHINTTQNNSISDRLRRAYEEWQRGETEWADQPRQPSGKQYLGENWSAPYRAIVGNSSVGMMLAATNITGLRALWDNEATFRYYDRLWNMEQGALQASNIAAGAEIGTFVRKMLESYWDETPTATVPAIASAHVRNARLWITFDSLLDYYGVPATSAFTVLVNGSPRTVSAVTDPTTLSYPSNYTSPPRSPMVWAHKLALTLASAVSPGDTVTVAYTQPGSNRLASVRGTLIPSFTATSVTNITGQAAANATVKKLADNGGTAWSQITGSYPTTSMTKLCIVMSFTVDDATGTPSYFGNATSSGNLICDEGSNPSFGSFRIRVANLVTYNTSGTAPGVGAHLLMFEVDFTQATITDACKMYLDGVSIPWAAHAMTTYTSGTFSVNTMLGTGLNLMRGLTASGTIANGKLEFFWMKWGTSSDAAVDITNSTVRSKFTTVGNAIGDNGEGPTGSPPNIFIAGSIDQYNSEEGVPNAGSFFGLSAKKMAGEYLGTANVLASVITPAPHVVGDPVEIQLTSDDYLPSGVTVALSTNKTGVFDYTPVSMAQGTTGGLAVYTPTGDVGNHTLSFVPTGGYGAPANIVLAVEDVPVPPDPPTGGYVRSSLRLGLTLGL